MRLKLWVDVAEITASLAVVATLVILIVQIRESNDIEQAQAALRQAQWDAQLFLMSDQLPNILAKIKNVDGHDLQPWMEQYDLSYAEAALWNRWLTLMWRGMEIDFMLLGPNEQLNQMIRNSAAWPDQQLFMHGAFFPGTTFFSDEFARYVSELNDDLQ